MSKLVGLLTIDQNDPGIAEALNRIYKNYGVRASVYEKAKEVLKFGQSNQVQQTATTLQEFPTGVFNEDYVYRNIITTISSTDVNDKGIEYLETHYVGDDKSVTLTQTGGTATGTSTAHGFAVGDWVYIEGAVQTGYNGIVQVLTVPTADTFTYSVDSATVSPATGTITATLQKYVFLTQTPTLNGQTQVSLPTPCARVSRRNFPEQNRAEQVKSLGTIYVYENDTSSGGVPTNATSTPSTVHLKSTNHTSQKASSTLEDGVFGIVTSIHGHNLTKQASFADIRLEVRKPGGIFKEVEDVSVSSSANQNGFDFKPYLIIPPNSDFRLVGLADVDGRTGGGSIQMYLAKEI